MGAVACARLGCWNFPPGARRQGSVPGWLDSAGAGGGDFPSLTLGEAGGWSRWGGGKPDLGLEPPRPGAVVLPHGAEPALWGFPRQGAGKGSSEETHPPPSTTAEEPLLETAAFAGRPFCVLALILLLCTPGPWTGDSSTMGPHWPPPYLGNRGATPRHPGGSPSQGPRGSWGGVRSPAWTM